MCNLPIDKEETIKRQTDRLKRQILKRKKIALDFVVFCVFVTFVRNVLLEYITGTYSAKFFLKEKSMVFSVFLQKKHSQQINLEKLTIK